MILYLIRHAQSENNLLAENIRNAAGEFNEEAYHDYIRKRKADPSLTELGFRQAEQLAQHLREAKPKHRAGYDDPGVVEPGEFGDNPYGITRLFCSPMLRALQTAHPVSEALGLPPRVWVELHEHGGAFDNSGEEGTVVGHPGLTRQQIMDQFPACELPEEITEEGWWFGEEEDRAGCHARAIRVALELRDMVGKDGNERVALIAHGTFLDSLLKALIGRLPGSDFHFGLYNTSITRLDFTTSYETGLPFVVVRYTNRVDHLSPDLIT